MPSEGHLKSPCAHEWGSSQTTAHVGSEFFSLCWRSLTGGEMAQRAVRKKNFCSWRFPYLPRCTFLMFPRIFIKNSSCSLDIQTYFFSKNGVSNIMIPTNIVLGRAYSSLWASWILTEGIWVFSADILGDHSFSQEATVPELRIF